MTKEKASYFGFSETFNKYDESLTSIKNQESFVYVSVKWAWDTAKQSLWDPTVTKPQLKEVGIQTVNRPALRDQVEYYQGIPILVKHA